MCSCMCVCVRANHPATKGQAIGIWWRRCTINQIFPGRVTIHVIRAGGPSALGWDNEVQVSVKTYRFRCCELQVVLFKKLQALFWKCPCISSFRVCPPDFDMTCLDSCYHLNARRAGYYHCLGFSLSQRSELPHPLVFSAITRYMCCPIMFVDGYPGERWLRLCASKARLMESHTAKNSVMSSQWGQGAILSAHDHMVAKSHYATKKGSLHISVRLQVNIRWISCQTQTSLTGRPWG